MADNSEGLSDFDRKTVKRLDIFWLGTIIYFTGFTLSTTTTVSYVFCQLLQILGVILFVPTAVKLVRWKFDNSYLKVLFFIYISWLTTVVVRGFSLEYDAVKVMLLDVDAGIFPFFVPVIVLFPRNLLYYKGLFRVICMLGILFIIHDILFLNNLLNLDYTNNAAKFTFEHFTKMLSVPSGFILLTFLYHTNRRKWFAAFVIAVSVAFSVIRARRALLFMNITPLIISYVFYLGMGKRRFLALFLSVTVGSAVLIYGVKIFNNSKGGVLGLLTERMYEDTRTNVEECLYEDLSIRDWIIGKGINGKYYCPDIDVEDTTGYRSMIETDYLNIILKGGAISLGLLLLILIPAIIKGVFFSRNLLSKAAAVWILLWVIELYPTNVYSFSLNHILVWISVGICYSKPIRMLPESILVETLSDGGLAGNKRVVFQSFLYD